MRGDKERMDAIYSYLLGCAGWVKPETIVHELDCYYTSTPLNHLGSSYGYMRGDVREINMSSEYEHIIVSHVKKGYKIGTQKEAEKYRANLIKRLKKLVRLIKSIEAKMGDNYQLSGFDSDELHLIETYVEEE